MVVVDSVLFRALSKGSLTIGQRGIVSLSNNSLYLSNYSLSHNSLAQTVCFCQRLSVSVTDCLLLIALITYHYQTPGHLHSHGRRPRGPPHPALLEGGLQEAAVLSHPSLGTDWCL